METTFQVVDQILIAKIDGSLTQSSVDLSTEIMSQIEDNNSTGVLVNLSKIQFLDSSGLGLIVSILNNTKSKEKKFGICCLNEYNSETIKISGLHQAFSVFETEEEGIKAFK